MSEPFFQETLFEAKRLFQMALVDPVSALQRLQRVLGVARAHLLFRGAELGRRVGASGYVRVVSGGRIALGDHVQFAGGMTPSEILCRPGAELVIGERSGFNYGVVIDCSTSIRIGARCMFGSMCCLRDTTRLKSGPIVIEDGVWVAHGAIIEPGVHIGAGSVVSAGSVVTKDVPPDSLAVGNPAESVALGNDVKRDAREMELSL